LAPLFLTAHFPKYNSRSAILSICPSLNSNGTRKTFFGGKFSSGGKFFLKIIFREKNFIRTKKIFKNYFCNLWITLLTDVSKNTLIETEAKNLL
jgi:hypothetical protein